MKRKLAGLLASGLLLGTALPAMAAQKTYYCFGHRATIVGTPRPDDLYGTDGPDVIAARGGVDRVSGGDGNDLICGGAGDDSSENYTNSGGQARLSGDNGDDWIRGGRGWDDLNGGPGADVLYGGWGKDHVLDYRHDHEYADPEPLPGSDDLLFGGPGNDTLTATAGDDFLSGGPGIDSLLNSGWDWDDYSYEETLDHGSDTYLGGAGGDRIETIDGVAGNDTVNAGEGIDACLGDEGDTIGACEGEYSPPD